MSEQTRSIGNGDQVTDRNAQELVDLRHWLANEDVYTSNQVRNWLQHNTPARAANVLAMIAANARPEPHSILYMILRGLAMVFTTSEAVSEHGPAGRKAAKRAAMLLANLHDPRCLRPLVRVFETSWFWEGSNQDLVEAALFRFLTGAEGNSDLSQYSDEIRSLASRVWNAGGGRRELTPTRADLLIAAMKRLKEIGTGPDLNLLASVATAKTNRPNRARVIAAARSLLEQMEQLTR
jgi:hypothetical protein